MPSNNQRILSRVLLVVGIVFVIGLFIFVWFITFGPKKEQPTATPTPTPTDSTVYAATPTPNPPPNLTEIIPSFDDNAFKVRTSGVIAFENITVGYERSVLYFRGSKLEVKEDQLFDGGNEVTYVESDNLFIVNSQQKQYYFLPAGSKSTTLADISLEQFRNSHPLAILYRDIKAGTIKPTRDKEGLWDVNIPTKQINASLPVELPGKLVLTEDQRYIARMVLYKPNSKTRIIYGDLQFSYEKTDSSTIDNLKKVPSGYRRNNL